VITSSREPAASANTSSRPSGDQLDRSGRPHSTNPAHTRRREAPSALTKTSPPPVTGCNASSPPPPANAACARGATTPPTSQTRHTANHRIARISSSLTTQQRKSSPQPPKTSGRNAETASQDTRQATPRRARRLPRRAIDSRTPAMAIWPSARTRAMEPRHRAPRGSIRTSAAGTFGGRGVGCRSHRRDAVDRHRNVRRHMGSQPSPAVWPPPGLAPLERRPGWDGALCDRDDLFGSQSGGDRDVGGRASQTERSPEHEADMRLGVTR